MLPIWEQGVRDIRRDALKIAGAAGVMAALPWSGIAEAEAAARR